MAQGKQALKSRIRSTSATMKITSAMELMANSKLGRQRQKMEQNKEYSEILLTTLVDILNKFDDKENIYLKNQAKAKLFIVFSSDLGLCGGYNNNMLRYASELITNDDFVIAIGSKAYKWFNKPKYQLAYEYIDSDELTYEEIQKVMNEVLVKYRNKDIGQVNLIFTKFVNSVTFEVDNIQLLPLKINKDKIISKQEILFEPNAETILKDLIPMALNATVYSKWLETKTSEMASRRMAMESATDNAQELKDKLVLQYNQARQAAITQEITEIVAGADSI